MLSTPPQLPNSTDLNSLSEQTDKNTEANKSDTESLHKSISKSSSSSSLSPRWITRNTQTIMATPCPP
ncbi:ANL_collapsed_G0019470.mRNA.1.CDS.1 [Saccharomyces cerevisiae]|nr:ANL_collapsed_G0019470.mRNA.1.CDS.1 [Saccharomyces cerevisiae]